jgi:hypothetical protein
LKAFDLPSLSVFADQRDECRSEGLGEAHDKAKSAVTGKALVKLEDQLRIIRGFDDKRSLIFGLGLVKRVVYELLTCALEIIS